MTLGVLKRSGGRISLLMTVVVSGEGDGQRRPHAALH